jgi:tRNA threonylcarbamoyladenosine biosynthesis protein TsaB
MILLAIDTSGKDGSIALARVAEEDSARRANGVEIEILEQIPLQGGTFSAQLVPQISGLLVKHGLGKSDLGAFAVASGPGSFTGLRVGLAAIKALAEVLGKPIAAVSRLEAIAYDLVLAGRTMTEELSPIDCLAVALDASRGQVFLGEAEYNEGDTLPKTFRESLVTLEELSQLGSRWGRGVDIYTPDQSVWEFLKANSKDPFLFNAYHTDRPDAASIARLGAVKLRRGTIVSPEHLEANYIRRSDAEIFAKS